MKVEAIRDEPPPPPIKEVVIRLERYEADYLACFIEKFIPKGLPHNSLHARKLMDAIREVIK